MEQKREVLREVLNKRELLKTTDSQDNTICPCSIHFELEDFVKKNLSAKEVAELNDSERKLGFVGIFKIPTTEVPSESGEKILCPINRTEIFSMSTLVSSKPELSVRSHKTIFIHSR